MEGHAAKIEDVVELRDIHDELARKILLVVLDDEWNVARVNALLGEVRVQVLHALDVLLDLAALAVRHEHDPVRTLQHELSCRGVVDLPRNRVELQAGREARDRSEIERKEIEEERAVGLRRERDHRPAAVARHLIVDVVQVARLAGPSGAVVDDLAGDLARGVVDEGHGDACGQILPNNFARLRLRSDSKSTNVGGAAGVAAAAPASRRLSSAK